MSGSTVSTTQTMCGDIWVNELKDFNPEWFSHRFCKSNCSFTSIAYGSRGQTKGQPFLKNNHAIWSRVQRTENEENKNDYFIWHCCYPLTRFLCITNKKYMIQMSMCLSHTSYTYGYVYGYMYDHRQKVYDTYVYVSWLTMLKKGSGIRAYAWSQTKSI